MTEFLHAGASAPGIWRGAQGRFLPATLPVHAGLRGEVEQVRTIEPEKLEYVMECTRLAPSAVNLQPWKFYIVSKPEDCAKMRPS